MTVFYTQEISVYLVSGINDDCSKIIRLINQIKMQKKPEITCEMAIDLALRFYGLKVLKVQEMVSFDDRNFYIQVSSSHENPYLETLSPHGYTLKIMNTTNTAKPGHFESIHYSLKFLHKKGLRVPLPVKNLQGNTWSAEKLPLVRTQGSAEDSPIYALCGIHLLTYIPGSTIDSIPYTEDILQQWGKLLGQFQNSLEDFSNDVLFNKDTFWNLYHLPEIVPFMKELDGEKTELVLDVLRSYDKEIKPSLAELSKGYIHGDFNETNVLVQKTSSGYRVDGILDLEDMHYGPYVWDVGLMLAYVTLDCEDVDPIKAIGHALAGYLQLRTFSKKEMSLLKACISCRLCQSLVLGAYNYQLNPNNPYFMRSARSGWNMLRLIWSTPTNTALKRWDEIRQKLK